jgi:hypothetical protein
MKGSFVVAAVFLYLGDWGAAWMFRYDAKDSGYGTLLVTDRWTGNVYRCGVVVPPKTTDGCVKKF